MCHHNIFGNWLSETTGDLLLSMLEQSLWWIQHCGILPVGLLWYGSQLLHTLWHTVAGPISHSCAKAQSLTSTQRYSFSSTLNLRIIVNFFLDTNSRFLAKLTSWSPDWVIGDAYEIPIRLAMDHIWFFFANIGRWWWPYWWSTERFNVGSTSSSFHEGWRGLDPWCMLECVKVPGGMIGCG